MRSAGGRPTIWTERMLWIAGSIGLLLSGLFAAGAREPSTTSHPSSDPQSLEARLETVSEAQQQLNEQFNRVRRDYDSLAERLNALPALHDADAIDFDPRDGKQPA